MNVTKTKGQKNKKSFLDFFKSLSQSKIVIVIFLLITTLVYISNYSAVFDKKIDMNGDNIHYFSLGKALAEDKGYVNTLGFTESPHGHFPPGYPAFVSIILKIHPNDIIAVKKANGMLLYGSIILLFFSIYYMSRNSILAFIASLLASMHSEMLRFASIMMSEPLCIFLSMLAIFLAILLIQWDFNKRKKWQWITLTILLAISIFYLFLVRTMGLALILALLAWVGCWTINAWWRLYKSKKDNDTEETKIQRKHLWSRAILVMVIALSFVSSKTMWDHRNKQCGISGKDYENTFFVKANNGKMEGTADWKERIKSNTSHFITRWLPQATCAAPFVDDDAEFTRQEWIGGSILAFFLLLGGVFGFGSFLMLMYAGITIGVLTLYPEWYNGVRYIIPIVPALIYLLLNNLNIITGWIVKLVKIKSSPIFFQAIILLLSFLFWLSPRYASAQEKYRNWAKIKSWTSLNDVHQNNYLKACEWCADSIPDTARVSCRKPEIFFMYSKYHHAIEFPRYAEPDVVYDFLVKNNISHVILDDWYKHAYTTLFPCIKKYEEKFMVLKEIGEADTAAKVVPTYVLQFNDDWGYKGDLVDGKRQGEGILRFHDGRCYEGHFENGLPNGYGTFTDTAGNIYKGYWKNGSAVKITERILK